MSEGNLHPASKPPPAVPRTDLSRPQLLRRVAGAALVWSVTTGALLGALVVLEHRFGGALSPRARDVTHLARGLVVSLVSTLVTARYLLRGMGASLESGLGSAGVGHREAERTDAGTTWLLALRWVALLALVAVVAFATLASTRLPPGSAPMLWIGVGLLFAFNLVLSVLDIRWLSSQRALSLQIAGDVLILGWLLHHSGGLSNPFAGFFVFHAVLAGIVLEPARARRAAAAIAFFVSALTIAEVTVVPPACLLGPDRGCAPPDRLMLAGGGASVAIMVMGCALIVVVLVRQLVEERDRVTHERAKLQSILDCMADPLIYALVDGTVGMRNKVAEELWPNASLRVCHPEHKWEPLLERLKRPPDFSDHPILETAGRSFEASYAPVHGRSGEISGVVMVARDITERVHAQQLRMEQERMAVVGKLAAALAHEINNPLGSIALYTQLALGSAEDGHPLRPHLETISRNADLCKRVVRDLLDYSRRRPPERRRLEVSGLLSDVARTIGPQAERARVAVVRTGPDEREPTTILGDPDQLHQALVNLALNAIDAMPRGGTLRFGAVRVDDRVRIEVADTGTGISAEDRERVFTPFFTTKAQGTGLGLAVTRDVVAAHAGRIELDSRPGEGTTFTIVLPASEEPRSGSGKGQAGKGQAGKGDMVA